MTNQTTGKVLAKLKSPNLQKTFPTQDQTSRLRWPTTTTQTQEDVQISNIVLENNLTSMTIKLTQDIT